MAVLEKTITINASVNKVYSFLNKPENWKQIYPKITEIKDIQPLTAGYRYRWKFNMVVGMSCSVDSENTDVVSNQRLGYKNTCGIGGTRVVELNEIFTLNSEKGKTRLDYLANNSVHIPLVGKLFEPLFMEMNDRRIKSCFANLKAKMES